MTNSTRPPVAAVFTGLLLASALLMLWLGTMAAAWYAPAVALAMCGALLWTARAPKVLKALMVLNQVTAVMLIAILVYRRALQPAETITLDLSGIALIGNMLLGGPFLGILSIPLLALLARGRALPAWLASR